MFSVATMSTAVALVIVAGLLTAQLSPTEGFVPSPTLAQHPCCATLFASDTGAGGDDSIENMKLGEIRKELESYGVSTKSFLEKSELVDALREARADGKQPISGSKDNAGPGFGKSSKSANSGASTTGVSRQDQIKAEKEKCRGMKVGELKKELTDLGISTKSFFEKTEFVNALAEARVDGVKKARSRAGRSRQESAGGNDPSYRDVVMQKFNFDPRDPRNSGVLIDISLGR